MEIEIDLNKTVEQNAQVYYEKAKKAKSKIDGAETAVMMAQKKIKQIEKKELEESQIVEEELKRGKPQWYHKFRWFISSEGILCVGGRDATSNEIIIKKHVEEGEKIFHTEMAGSPFFVIKSGSKPAGDATIKECASAVASFSRAWKGGLGSAEVFWVEKDQVTKEAKAGEYISKGAFMIYGKKNIVENKIGVALGLVDGYIMCGPTAAVEKNCESIVKVAQGDEKPSAIAKKVKAKIGGDLDEIIRSLPSGFCRIVK
jgi:predicted ribosome quality control (RQC) complex YloA/Tae2 family protein